MHDLFNILLIKFHQWTIDGLNFDDGLYGGITGVTLGGTSYTACNLKLRPVKLLFVIFGRLSYSLFVNLMVWGNGRLSGRLNGRY